MQYFVYILFSKKLNRFYTGTTDNVAERFQEHNTHKCKDAFTAKGIPWELFLTIAYKSSKQAYAVEKFIKKMKSAVFIRKLKSDLKVLQDILDRTEAELKYTLT